MYFSICPVLNLIENTRYAALAVSEIASVENAAYVIELLDNFH